MRKRADPVTLVRSPTMTKLAEEAEAKIRSGELHPFTGPIKKQDGSDWLADGVTAPDGDLLGMNFYVEGITGDIPK